MVYNVFVNLADNSMITKLSKYDHHSPGYINSFNHLLVGTYMYDTDKQLVSNIEHERRYLFWIKKRKIKNPRPINNRVIKKDISFLLDSTLITQTENELYEIKIYNCNDYIQIYMDREKYRLKGRKSSHSYMTNIAKEIRKKREEEREEGTTTSPTLDNNEIRSDNAMRSKLNIQRLIKANEKVFKTFITLTFAINQENIALANKEFDIWRTKIKKIFPDFKYVCVPEYQKRGAVHYHLITNIPLKGSIITLQRGKKNMYDVPFWDKGFTSNRLFGRNKYMHSNNLYVPKPEYINTSDSRSMEYLNNLLKNKQVCYSNIYKNKYNNEDIAFIEYNSYNTYYVNL